MTAASSRACFGGWLEPELLVKPGAVGAVAVERLVLASERVEREHRQSLCALAEAVETNRRLGVHERRDAVKFRQRGIGCV